MKLVSIFMDNGRNLLPSSYSLGVERDHNIDKLVLVTEACYNDADLCNASVSLHLKADNGYLYNQVCGEKNVENGFAYFLFPVTREMTCVSGGAQIEFHFDNPAAEFCFTSRSVVMMVAKPLTDTAEVESDYPGILSDVLNSVSDFSSRLVDSEELLSRLDREVGVLFEKQDESALAIDSIKAVLGYTDEDILGLEADFENSTFTRLAGAIGLEAGADFDQFSMYQRRRCNVLDDGSIVAFHGDESYRDDGTNGQVMVYQPKFYYRVVPTKLEKQEGGLGFHIRKANYYISSKPKPFFKLHPAFYDKNSNPVEYILYSAYEASVSGNKTCSVAGVKPITNRTPTNLETLAQSRGSDWHIETIKSLSANQMLMMIEFASLDMQRAVGYGVVNVVGDLSKNCTSITGATASLGNSTGRAFETVNEIDGVETVYTDNARSAVSYRGVENSWGNCYKFISGLNLWGDGSMLGGQAYIASDFSFNDQKRDGNYVGTGFTCTNHGQACISAFGFGREEFDWLFLPSESKGTDVYPVGDITYGADNLNGYRMVVSGGAWYNYTYAGAFSYMMRYAPNAATALFGGRLIYVPTAK